MIHRNIQIRVTKPVAPCDMSAKTSVNSLAVLTNITSARTAMNMASRRVFFESYFSVLCSSIEKSQDESPIFAGITHNVGCAPTTRPSVAAKVAFACAWRNIQSHRASLATRQDINLASKNLAVDCPSYCSVCLSRIATHLQSRLCASCKTGANTRKSLADNLVNFLRISGLSVAPSLNFLIRSSSPVIVIASLPNILQ